MDSTQESGQRVARGLAASFPQQSGIGKHVRIRARRLIHETDSKTSHQIRDCFCNSIIDMFNSATPAVFTSGREELANCWGDYKLQKCGQY